MLICCEKDKILIYRREAFKRLTNSTCWLSFSTHSTRSPRRLFAACIICSSIFKFDTSVSNWFSVIFILLNSSQFNSSFMYSCSWSRKLSFSRFVLSSSELMTWFYAWLWSNRLASAFFHLYLRPACALCQQSLHLPSRLVCEEMSIPWFVFYFVIGLFESRVQFYKLTIEFFDSMMLFEKMDPIWEKNLKRKCQKKSQKYLRRKLLLQSYPRSSRRRFAGAYVFLDQAR